MPSTVLQPGATFDPPYVDKYRPPPGEITWTDDDPRWVSPKGPSLRVSVDFRNPRAKGREQIVVVRLRDVKGYLPTAEPAYADPHGNLAVSAIVRTELNGVAEDLEIDVPLICFPKDSGGITEVEIAVYEPSGPLVAIDYLQSDLPEDFDRSPDILSVLGHSLVALARVRGPLNREEVRVIRQLLVDNFDLDDLGDQALRRILKVASATVHSPETLSQVLGHVLPEQGHERLVTLLYACAEADGDLRPSEQRFISELLELLGVHDHRRFGPAALQDAYLELELEPGSELAAVKGAWKKLVRDYHPDRVQNLAQGFRDFAHDKTSRLNAAYDRLRKALATTHTEVEVELDE